MKITDFQHLSFSLAKKNPLISPPRCTPLIADPTVLLPEESPDKKWHLFAHSIFGIQHYLSENGVDWKKNKTVVRAAMRPFIYKENNMYFLFYEKYHAMKLLFSFLPNQRWYSQIEVVSSKDLIQWTTSKVLIKPMLNFHQDIN